MKLQGGNLRWPRAIRNFLELNDSRIPSPIVLAQNPVYHWSVLNEDPIGVQAAIAYTSQQKGEPPCQDGVSPLDLASLDRAVQERLPVRRVGEAVRVSGYRKKYWRPGKPKRKTIQLLKILTNSVLSCCGLM